MAAIRVIVHKRGIAKRRITKCGKTSRRQSERFDSTVEVGELNPYAESVGGNESSKHWIAFGQPDGGIELQKQVNETRANSITTSDVVKGAGGEL